MHYIRRTLNPDSLVTKSLVSLFDYIKEQWTWEFGIISLPSPQKT